MTKIKTLLASALAAGLLLGPQSAQAHCDSADGPVAAAAQKAGQFPDDLRLDIHLAAIDNR